MPNAEITLMNMLKELYPNFGIPGISEQFAASGRRISVPREKRVYIAQVASFDANEALTSGFVLPPNRHVHLIEATAETENPGIVDHSLRGVLLRTTGTVPILEQARFGPALLVSKLDPINGAENYGQAMRIGVEIASVILKGIESLI